MRDGLACLARHINVKDRVEREIEREIGQELMMYWYRRDREAALLLAQHVAALTAGRQKAAEVGRHAPHHNTAAGGQAALRHAYLPRRAYHSVASITHHAIEANIAGTIHLGQLRCS